MSIRYICRYTIMLALAGSFTAITGCEEQGQQQQQRGVGTSGRSDTNQGAGSGTQSTGSGSGSSQQSGGAGSGSR